MRYILILFVFTVGPGLPVQAQELHDGHIHYNQTIWRDLPPDHALEYMTESGISRAIVSSTPTEGTERLYRLAPDRVIPFIRPYRTLADVMSWHNNREILSHIKKKAVTGIYRGFGEFHMWIEHMPGSIIPELAQFAADQGWALSAHTDAESIEALAKMQPTVPVIWAHCGFDYPAAGVQQLMERYANVYCDLSLQETMTDEDDNLTPVWQALLERHPDRFLVGMDTNKAKRWGNLTVNVELAKEWLGQLSPRAAQLVASGNISRLFPPKARDKM